MPASPVCTGVGLKHLLLPSLLWSGSTSLSRCGEQRLPGSWPHGVPCSPLPGLPFAITPEGLERTFATNYLGPFLLTNLLLGE